MVASITVISVPEAMLSVDEGAVETATSEDEPGVEEAVSIGEVEVGGAMIISAVVYAVVVGLSATELLPRAIQSNCKSAGAGANKPMVNPALVLLITA